MEVINRRALFSDESESFVTPFTPEAGQKITIRFRAAKNDLISAQLLVRGEEPIPMELRRTDELFDVFEAENRSDTHLRPSAPRKAVIISVSVRLMYWGLRMSF